MSVTPIPDDPKYAYALVNDQRVIVDRSSRKVIHRTGHFDQREAACHVIRQMRRNSDNFIKEDIIRRMALR
jgi:hypothetical protein